MKRPDPWTLVLRPGALAAVAILLLNDHVLKAAASGALTGKLSDIAGLFFFPLLLGAAVLAIARTMSLRKALFGSVVATGALFGALKAFPSLGATAPGAISWVADPTDLVALAMLPLSYAYGLRVRTDGRWIRSLARHPVLRFACVVVVAAATVATSAAQGFRRFPYWEVGRGSHAVGGAIVQAWVSRSGSEGFGLSVDLMNAPGALPVELDSAHTVLRLHGERIRPTEGVPARAGPGEHARGYLVFEFDNRRAWNDGVRTAQLRLGLRVGGGRRAVLLALTHTRPSPHDRDRDEVEPHAIPPGVP